MPDDEKTEEKPARPNCMKMSDADYKLAKHKLLNEKPTFETSWIKAEKSCFDMTDTEYKAFKKKNRI